VQEKTQRNIQLVTHTHTHTHTIKLHVAQKWTLEKVVVAILLLDGQNGLFVQRLELFSYHVRSVRDNVRRVGGGRLHPAAD